MKSLLVFRIGSLGDTLVAVPSLWALRDAFPGASITLLSDQQLRKDYVLGRDLLEGSGAVDDFLSYPVDDSPAGKTLKALRMTQLLMVIRRRRFDALIYLAPSDRLPRAVARDRLFFRAAGIRNMLAMSGFTIYPARTGQPLEWTPREADHLLSRLERSGVPVPRPGEARIDLNLGKADEAAVEEWLRGLPIDLGRPWIGVGPGTKMPAKCWPEDRFTTVVARLISTFDVWPVVFGGPPDRQIGDRMVASWGRGYVAAGVLGPRATAAAMARCRFVVGNDTGTLHLAASAGVPCVGVYSSRDWPGLWYPYGDRHRVLRTSIDCEGCRLMECIDRNMECILSIDVESVTKACEALLTETLAHQR